MDLLLSPRALPFGVIDMWAKNQERETRQARPRLDVVATSLLFLVALFVLTWFARLDPDPHHDGVQFALALGMVDGRIEHREIFSQYGPITAWLHAATISLFGPYLLALRIETAVLLTYCVAITYPIGKLIGLTRLTSCIVSVAFLMTCPAWSVGRDFFALWPWPSVTFLVLALSATLVVLLSLRSKARREVLMAFSGLLVGLSIITRVNYGVPLALAFLVLIVWLRFSLDTWAKQLMGFCAGLLAGVFVPATALVLRGSFSSWLSQSIVGPLESSSAAPPSNWTFVLSTFVLGSVPIAIVAGVLLFFFSQQMRIRPFLLWFIALTLSGFLLALALAGMGSRFRAYVLSLGNQSWIPYFLDAQPLAPFYAAAVIVPLLVIIGVLRSKPYNRVAIQHLWSGARSVEVQSLTVALLVGISMLAQVYPLFDAYHLWWAGPLLVLAGMRFMERHMDAPTIRVIPIALLLPYVATGLITAVLEASMPRVQPTGLGLKGMLIPASEAQAERDVARLLASLPVGETQVECDDGLVAVWNGKYLAGDGNYVDWSWHTRKRQDPPDAIAVCSPRNGRESPEAIATRFGFAVVDRSETLILSSGSPFTLYIVRPTQ